MLSLARLMALQTNAVSLRAIATVMARQEHMISDRQFHKWLTVELKAMDAAEERLQAQMKAAA